MSVPVTSAVTDSQQLVDVVQLAVTQLNQSEVGNTGHEEPATKRMRVTLADDEVNTELSVKQILFNINKAICLRLDAIETKLDNVTARNKLLEEKVDQLSAQLKSAGNVVLSQSKGTPTGKKTGAVIVGLPQERGQSVDFDSDSNSNADGMDQQSIQNLGPNVQLITLNTEEDYPLGVWLGDESNPEMRVRVPITPSDLLHIHSNCRTPEKMALTLLDYLFDRETQASSNLSGMGKHNKKQLDPLMIYGIRCHLIHRFNISEQDWHRIKLNIDSKCRTAHRRLVKGLPLTVKSFRGRSQPEYVTSSGTLAHELSMNPDDLTDGELHIHQDGVDLSAAEVMASSAAEIIQSAGGQIQVIQATPEQVAQLQQAHQIQILQGDATQVIGQLHHGDGGEPLQVAVSLGQSPDGSIQVINAENGDTMQISADSLKVENDSSPNDDDTDQ